jgi:hypothetical protein
MAPGGRNEMPPAGLNQRMKPLILSVALLGILIAAPLKSNADTVVVHNHGGTVVHTHGGTAVHTNYNWNHSYWHAHKYGYWNGQRGYWHVVHGEHVFVVVE